VISADTSKLWATGKTLRSRNGDVKSKRQEYECFFKALCLCGIQGLNGLSRVPKTTEFRTVVAIFLKEFFILALIPNETKAKRAYPFGKGPFIAMI
jgi:hypothetical protein